MDDENRSNNDAVSQFMRRCRSSLKRRNRFDSRSAASTVSSVEPSSTKITSPSSPYRSNVCSSSRNRSGTFSLSFSAGMMTEKFVARPGSTCVCSYAFAHARGEYAQLVAILGHRPPRDVYPFPLQDVHYRLVR